MDSNIQPSKKLGPGQEVWLKFREPHCVVLMSKILNSHHAPLCPWHSPQKTEVAIELYMLQVNPLTSMSDWDRISPYCTISIHYQADKQGESREISIRGLLVDANPTFSQLSSQELNGKQ